MARKLRLDFKSLPLIEAAVRASFNGPRALTYTLVYSIAQELGGSFPSLEEPKQLEVAPGTGETPFTIGPGYLSGAVYTGNKHGLSVSVQPQVIVARWTKHPHPGMANPDYPRFPAVRDALWTTVEAFRKGCGDEYPGISVVNMSYVNFVPSGDSAGFLKTYFSSESQLHVMDKAKQVRKLEAGWSEGDDLDVRFAVEQATARMPDGVTAGYRLTTAAGLRLGESVDAKSGLETVHYRLQEFFLELISEQARTEWKLEEPAHA
jgi:uncharacterized protein (TIGR04255 family)